MKNVKSLLITTILAVCAAVVCLAFAACSSSDVSGKTYVFSSFQVTYDDTVEEEDKLSEEQIDSIKEYYNGMTLTFNSDGTYVMEANDGETQEGYYKQIGSKVYIDGNEEDLEGVEEEEDAYYLEASGNKVTMSETYNGITVKYIFNKK